MLYAVFLLGLLMGFLAGAAYIDAAVVKAWWATAREWAGSAVQTVRELFGKENRP